VTKAINAKTWQLVPASDGRRYSAYPDGNLPTVTPTWSLPATISVPAGTSVGVRQYTTDADGWTIAVTSLATGLSYNSGTESIDAADTTAASGTATFTLSKAGETDVVDTATVALTNATINILWQDPLDIPAFADATDNTKGWRGTSGTGPLFSAILTDSQWSGPSLRPQVSWGGNGNGWHCGMAKPGGGTDYYDGPKLPNRAASIRFQLDNNEAQVGDGPPFDWDDQVDPAGGSTTRRRVELYNFGASQASGVGNGLGLYAARTPFWHALAMYIPSDFDLTQTGSAFHLMQFKTNPDTNPSLLLNINGGEWELYHHFHRTTGFLTATEGVNAFRYRNSSTDARVAADYPSAEGRAAWSAPLRGDWTFWAFNISIDNRTASEGSTGFLDVYKREGLASTEWLHCLAIRPRVLSDGIEQVIMKESTGTTGGSYNRVGFYNSSGAEETRDARPAHKWYLGRILTADGDSNLPGIWSELNA